MSRAEFTTDERKSWMGLLARAQPARLAGLMPSTLPSHHDLRSPEVGTMMVRGRAGGTGSAFNLGEVTVTRCSLRLEGNQVGHAVVQGRDRAHARRAAIIDALMQSDQATQIRDTVLRALDADEKARRETTASHAAATRVDFFTLVRGEDK